MRKLVARAADTGGNVVQIEWPVPEGKRDGHADAHSAVLGFYEQLVGDSPDAVSLEVTTTFVASPRGAQS